MLITPYRTLSNNIQAGLRYNVEVTALNIAGEGTPAMGYKIVGATPSAPYGLKLVSSVPSGTLVLSWKVPLSSGGLPITGYTLNKAGTDIVAAIGSTTTQYTDDISVGGTIGTVITYKIKATNAAGSSDYSDSLVAQIGSLPNAPQGLTLVSRPSNSSVILSWTAETAIASNFPTLGYRLYNSDLGTVLFDCTKSSIVLQATITGLTTGATYKIVARTVNTLGESVDSTPALIVIAGLPPAKMAQPTLSTSTITSITIKWVEPSSNGGLPITGYKVYFDVGQTGTYAPYTITDTTIVTYTQNLLTTGTKVNFKVSAVNSVSEGSTSDIVTFIAAVVPTAPAAPTLLSTYMEDSTYISLEVQWVAPPTGGSSLTGYKLYVSRSDESAYTLALDGSNRPDILSYVSKGRLIGYTYNYKVSAINGVGESAYSPILQVVAAAKPSQPRNLGISATAAGSITVVWEAPATSGGLLISSYSLYYSADTSPYTWTSVTGISSSTLTKQITGLVVDTAYAFKVAAVNSVGEGTASAIVTQYASAVPSALPALSVISGSRTLTSVGLSWTAPTSTIPVRKLGFSLPSC